MYHLQAPSSTATSVRASPTMHANLGSRTRFPKGSLSTSFCRSKLDGGFGDWAKTLSKVAGGVPVSTFLISSATFPSYNSEE